MTNRLDEMVERAARAVAGCAGDNYDELPELVQAVLVDTQRAALTEIGVPSLLEEVERLRIYSESRRALLVEWKSRAEAAEAELQAVKSNIEEAPQATVQMLGTLILSDINTGCLRLVGQRVHLLPAPSGEVQS